MAVLPKKYIPTIMPYPPGKPIEEVQREYGLDSVVKLASNENPLGPSPKAVKAMQEAAEEMHLYPDGNGYYLKTALAKKYKVPTECICLGNGSDEITDLIATAYIRQTDNVVFAKHSFISYKLAAKMVNARVTEVPLRNWQVDVDGLIAAVDDKTRLVCLANPGNPVGTMTDRKDLERLLKVVPRDVMILVDEAYAEYVTSRDYPSAARYLKDHPNLVVTRTFSKAYGLAGLRIGYAFADSEIVKNFDRVRPPFNANRIAQIAALAALEDETHIEKSIASNKEGRALLEEEIKDLGMDIVPCHTNFILFDTGRDGAELTGALLKEGVIVRPMAGYGLPQHIRVTIGKPGENRKFIAAFKRCL